MLHGSFTPLKSWIELLCLKLVEVLSIFLGLFWVSSLSGSPWILCQPWFACVVGNGFGSWGNWVRRGVVSWRARFSSRSPLVVGRSLLRRLVALMFSLGRKKAVRDASRRTGWIGVMLRHWQFIIIPLFRSKSTPGRRVVESSERGLRVSLVKDSPGSLLRISRIPEGKGMFSRLQLLPTQWLKMG